MNRLLPIALIGLLVALGVGYWFSQSSDTAPEAAAVQVAEATETVASDAAADMGVTEMIMGAADAPVTIIEYASFTCPHCATFHEHTLKDLKKNYVDTGKVKFIFREVYFDRFGLWASMVARCGGVERFFGMADLLMKGQSEWSRAGDPVAIAGELRKVGRLAGLEDDALQACLQDEAEAKKLISWFEANAKADDISSTPTLIVNGKKHGNTSYTELKAIVDAELGN